MPIINEYDATTDTNVEIQISQAELETAIGEVNIPSFVEILAAQKALKDSARAKLIAGQPLTADEASVLVI